MVGAKSNTAMRSTILRADATAFTLLGLVLFAAFSWQLPLIGFAERWLHDYRVAAFAPVIEPHPVIRIVEFTPETLAKTRQRSPLSRQLLADAITKLSAAKPLAMGIDILIDQPESPQADAALHKALLDSGVPVVLAMATQSSSSGYVLDWQEAFMRDWFSALDASLVRPGSVVLKVEGDGVIRRAPALHSEGFPAFAGEVARAAMIAETEPEPDRIINFRRSASDSWPFVSVPIEVVAGMEPTIAQRLFEGKVVLIGARLPGADQHRTPLSALQGETMPGLGVHAQLLAQLIDSAAPVEVGGLARSLIGVVVVAAGYLLGLVSASLRLRIVLGLCSVTSVWLIAVAMQYWTTTAGTMLPLAGATVAWLIAFLFGSLRSNASLTQARGFIRDALAKYVPPAVAEELERNPEKLSIHGERVNLAILFTDIAGFTSFSESLPPETVSIHLNEYLDGMTQIVHRHGGTLDKYIGDAIVAFWGAPIETEDGARRSIQCACELGAYATEFSAGRQADGLPFGITRIGVHFGPAIVGNFGGQERFQYTAIGDTVNTAARLESANKYFDTSILISDDVRNEARYSSCRQLGGLILKGRTNPIMVHEPMPQWSEELLAAYRTCYDMFQQDPDQAIAGLQKLLDEGYDDHVLHSFVQRLKENEGSPIIRLHAK